MNNLQNPAKSAKLPSPVQIRAAPPTFLKQVLRFRLRFAAQVSLTVPKCPCADLFLLCVDFFGNQRQQPIRLSLEFHHFICPSLRFGHRLFVGRSSSALFDGLEDGHNDQENPGANNPYIDLQPLFVSVHDTPPDIFVRPRSCSAAELRSPSLTML